MKQKLKASEDIRHILLRLTRVHFFYVAIYLLATVVFDSWNLLAYEAVVERWTLGAALLVVVTLIWYACRLPIKSPTFYKTLFAVLLLADIIFAAVNIYLQRGMASKSVMLFAVPIISAALSRSRSLLLATTTVSVAAYSLSSVRYFFENYGQGYRVELYGEVFFYSALMFVLSYLAMIFFVPAKD